MPHYMKDTREAVIARDKRVCRYCGKTKLYKRSLNLDHVVAESAGGEFSLNNLIVSCKQCNHRKGKKPVYQYISERIEAIALEKSCLERLLSELKNLN